MAKRVWIAAMAGATGVATGTAAANQARDCAGTGGGDVRQIPDRDPARMRRKEESLAVQREAHQAAVYTG